MNNIAAAYYILSLLFVEGDEIVVVSRRDKFVDTIRKVFEGQQMGLKVVYARYEDGMKMEFGSKTKAVIMEKV